MNSDSATVPPAGARRRIGDDEIHIYRTTLEGPEPEHVLSLDERTRAARFHFARDRRKFVVARAFVRGVLGEYLGINPADVRFGYTAYGKPFLDWTMPVAALSFNVAHSEDLAMMAVARGRAVGIDVEHHKPGFATDTVAEQFFSPDEVRAIRGLRSEEQERAFFDCWTRKEAYIKARGQGLSIPLNGFTVSTARHERSALLSTDYDPLAAVGWRVCDLEAPVRYSAALAYELGSTMPKVVLAEQL